MTQVVLRMSPEEAQALQDFMANAARSIEWPPSEQRDGIIWDPLAWAVYVRLGNARMDAASKKIGTVKISFTGGS